MNKAKIMNSLLLIKKILRNSSYEIQISFGTYRFHFFRNIKAGLLISKKKNYMFTLIGDAVSLRP